mgnify:CR=1 FL=1
MSSAVNRTYLFYIVIVSALGGLLFGFDSGVISGCINESGLLQVRTAKAYADSTVSRILELVENSALVKSKAENAVYVDAVVALHPWEDQ